MPEIKHSMCPLDCPDACSLEVTVEDGRLARLDGDHRNPLTDGFICGKVRGFGERLYHRERLRTPLVRVPGSQKGTAAFEPASWDTALSLVAARIASARERHGGESILPCCYGGSNGKFTQDSSDAALFRRLGASRLHRGLCAAATTMASAALYGGMPGIALPDYRAARTIVVWGTNPHASGIHHVPHLQAAREAGAELIVVDPRRTKLARMASLHVAPRPGTDLVLALALIRWFFETGRADLDFLARHATGAEELRRRAAPWTFERAAATCQLDVATLERFAHCYAEGSPAALRCGWGPERNRNGCAAIAAILALPAVAGKFGQRGGGYTMSNGRAFAQALRPLATDPEASTRLIHDLRLGRALLEARDPAIEVLFVYNANPLSTFPDQERVRRGFLRPGLFTVVFDQVMTDSALYADVVLPATTFLEHDELRGGYGAMVLQLAGPVLDPVGEARPNYAVFAELLRRLSLERPGDDFTPEGMLRRGVADPEAAEALRSEGIVFPSCGDRPVQFVDVFPQTSDGKIHLVPAELDGPDGPPFYHYRPDPGDARHPLVLISPATEKLISSSFGERIEGAQPLRLHPVDARTRGIADGDSVRIWNELGEVVTHARLDERLKEGVVELHKGLWSRHTRNGATATALAPDSMTDRGFGACYNDARVEVSRLDP